MKVKLLPGEGMRMAAQWCCTTQISPFCICTNLEGSHSAANQRSEVEPITQWMPGNGASKITANRLLQSQITVLIATI